MATNPLKNIQYTGPRNPQEVSIPVGLVKRDATLLRGIVKYVDIERFTITCDIVFTSEIKNDITIAMPYAGPSSFISAMPEVGSGVLLAQVQDAYFPIAFVPLYYMALEHDYVKLWPETVQAKGNDFFYKHRKLRQGEINIGSAQGSELLLSYDALLENEYGDSILIRNADHSIVTTSLSNSMLSSGVWVNAGVISRNMLKSSNIDKGQFAREHVLRDGRVIYQLKPEDSNALSNYYSEYLIEVSDQGSAEHPSNSMNEMVDIDPKNPVAVFSLGNFVGNNPAKEGTYGKMLGISLFESHDAKDGMFKLKELIKEQPDKYGMAATIYAPNRFNYENGAAFAIDKEGHFYQYIPAATGGGLGKGRSMSILAKGNKKEIWGADSILNNSWDILLEGGVKWRIGSHNSSDYDLRNTSMDIVTKGKVYFQYGEDVARSIKDFDQPDKLVQNVDKYRKIEKVSGYERDEITGTREVTIGGGDRLSIKGMKTEKINGFYTTHVGGNRNISVGDTYSLKVINEGQESFGNKKIECTKGSHELTIFSSGDIKETINVRGTKSVKITSGDISETIVTQGGRSFSTTSGNYKVNVLSAGNVTHKTSAGSIVSETKAGKMDMKSSLGMNLKTNAMAKIEGLKVQFKTPAPKSSVITKLTSTCYITGANHPGHPMIEG